MFIAYFLGYNYIVNGLAIALFSAQFFGVIAQTTSWTEEIPKKELITTVVALSLFIVFATTASFLIKHLDSLLSNDLQWAFTTSTLCVFSVYFIRSSIKRLIHQPENSTPSS
jgi:hypothetical protein